MKLFNVKQVYFPKGRNRERDRGREREKDKQRQGDRDRERRERETLIQNKINGILTSLVFQR